MVLISILLSTAVIIRKYLNIVILFLSLHNYGLKVCHLVSGNFTICFTFMEFVIPGMPAYAMSAVFVQHSFASNYHVIQPCPPPPTHTHTTPIFCSDTCITHVNLDPDHWTEKMSTVDYDQLQPVWLQSAA